MPKPSAQPETSDARAFVDAAVRLTQVLAGPLHAVRDPFDGSLLARVRTTAPADVPRAIGAAQQAQPGWAASLAEDRARKLRAWAALMRGHKQALASLVTAEQGKPLREALAEVDYAAAYLDWFAEEARRAYGQTIPTFDSVKRLASTKSPVGVCAAITPWNFPLAMITRKVGPALAAGCAMVVKPSEWTPLCALALAHLAREAGIPGDLLPVLPATAETNASIGAALCASEVVRKLSFTGSTEVGRILMRQCADTVKRLSLELGGNAPFVVFDDADVEAAVAGAVASKFRNAGQTCVCANRFLVQSAIHDRFVDALVREVSRLRVGRGSDPDVDVGPLISDRAVDKVRSLVADAVRRGAIARLGADPQPAGRSYPPTVLTEVSADALVVRQEIFGPVVAVQRFDTEDQAVALANDSEYGLAAYLYSRDFARCHRVSERLAHGMVGVNTGVISSEVVPFGGVKQSGFGREGGSTGLDEYLETKYVCASIG